MKKKYYVYKTSNISFPLISAKVIHENTFDKPLYVGKKAKLEALKRYDGTVLAANLTTPEIKSYLQEHIYNTPTARKKYETLLNAVYKEKKVVTQRNEILYELEVELDASVLNKDITYEDDRIISMISSELTSVRLESYKGLTNPIIAIKKILPRKKTLDECFAELIQNEKWYEKNNIDRKLASKHKSSFLNGKLSDTIKRDYLIAAGYRLAQPELWEKTPSQEE